jgi:hypothetical protein
MAPEIGFRFMTKVDFIASSAQIVVQLEDWIAEAESQTHTQVTPQQLAVLHQAKDIIDQAAVRLIRKDSNTH